MKSYSSKMIGIAALATMLAVMCSAQVSISAQIQWGFDYTSGTVASQNGGVIENDGTGGSALGGEALYATPEYSSDIPLASRTQFVTGIGSVDVSTGGSTGPASIQVIGTTSNLGSSADMIAAGGLTTEVWVKRLDTGSWYDERVFQLGNDWYGLTTSETYVEGISATSGWPHPQYVFPVDTATSLNNKWTHLALVYDVEPGDGDDIFSLYINGEQVAQQVGTRVVGSLDYVPDLDNAGANHITFGNNEGTTKGFKGLIYEPRITLGVLSPSEFTVVTVPEPTTLALLGMGLFWLIGLRLFDDNYLFPLATITFFSRTSLLPLG